MIHAREDYNRFQEPAPLLVALSLMMREFGPQLDEKARAEIQALLDSYPCPSVHPDCKPIGEDEPVMIFRGQDKHFVAVVAHYRTLLLKDAEGRPINDNDRRMDKVLTDHIYYAKDWQAENGCKTPDMPEVK